MSDPQPILQGTWGEVLTHKNDIPATMRVKVIADMVDQPDLEEAEYQNHQTALNQIFAEADALDYAPPTAPIPPYGQAVLEKYRKQGWNL
jgi:hypothetical protein